MRHWTVILLLVMGAFPVEAQKPSGKGPARKAVTANEDRFEQMAVAGAATIQGMDRAAVFCLLGHAYSSRDKKKARDYYEQALAAYQQFQDDKIAGAGALQREIVVGFAGIAPESALEALPPNPELRNAVLLRVVDSQVEKKDNVKALEAYSQMQDGVDLYVAASDLLAAAPESDTSFRSSVFDHAFAIYRGSAHKHSTIGDPEDMVLLIVRCWKSLPKSLVLEAVDNVLDEAREESERTKAPWVVSMETTGGSVTFKSAYEYRMYELSAVLKELDPSRWKEMEQQYPILKNTSALFAQEDKAKALGARNISLSWDSASAMDSVRRMDNAFLRDKLTAEIEQDDTSSVKTAAAIPDPKLRVSILAELAAHYATAKPDVAIEALAAIASVDGACINLPACFNSIQIAAKLKATDVAQKLLSSGFKVVELFYKKDADPNDPNLALKLFWPSTQVWRDLMKWQLKVDPARTDAALKTIPDDEIKTLVEALLVGQELNGKVWSAYSPMVSHRRDQ